MNNREFSASGDQALPLENSYFFAWGDYTIQVVENYGGDQGTYQATITFDMIHMEKASDVKVMVLYPDNTVEYHDVSSLDGHHRSSLSCACQERKNE